MRELRASALTSGLENANGWPEASQTRSHAEACARYTQRQPPHARVSALASSTGVCGAVAQARGRGRRGGQQWRSTGRARTRRGTSTSARRRITISI
jgi:hypothetical protein